MWPWTSMQLLMHLVVILCIPWGDSPHRLSLSLSFFLSLSLHLSKSLTHSLTPIFAIKFHFTYYIIHVPLYCSCFIHVPARYAFAFASPHGCRALWVALPLPLPLPVPLIHDPASMILPPWSCLPPGHRWTGRTAPPWSCPWRADDACNGRRGRDRQTDRK